jgi:tripartite-type tricarboxylate transporter receptor subunit TctC
MTYASTGVGTVEHLSAVLLANAAKLDVTHVPYQGTAAAMQGMLAGEADFAFTNPSVLGEHIRSGRVRALAVASETRQPSFPDIPTLKELGVNNVIAESWYGFAVPAKTPKPVVDKLSKVLMDAMSKPTAQDRIRLLGLVPAPQGPEDFDKYVRDEYAKWKPLIHAANAAAK